MRIRLRAPHSKNQWILLLLGLGVTAACAVPLTRGFMSLAWPKVDGVIVYSRDKVVYRRLDVDIGYRYSVAGKSYTANRYRFQYPLLRIRSRDVNVAIGRYRVGEPVKVAVNPSDPTDAVLEAGPDFETLIPLGLGVILILLGVGEPGQHKDARRLPPFPEPAVPRYRTAKVLAVIGACLFLLGAWYLYQGLGSTTWPATPGRILYSRAQMGNQPETLLWYEYFVENRRYLASNYRNGGNVTPFRKVAEEAARRYPAGRTVSVYYDPANPANALLEPGVWWGNFVLPAIALVVLFAAWVAKRFAEARAASGSRRS